MSRLAFALPHALEASSPPEARGVDRDGVKLLVARRSERQIAHARFADLAALLTPGDLIVVNVSATLPAAVAATRADGSPTRVHFASRAPALHEGWRVVELRSADGAQPSRGRPGESIELAGGAAALELVAPYASGSRLLLARFRADDQSVEAFLAEHGSPIRYGYIDRGWPLADYQNVYATTPGSAEMPSAGRPFSARLITNLVARGVGVVPVTLHAGVSSPARHEPPLAERYEVPPATARAINSTRAAGGRVVAVGTTVVRALETVTDGDRTVAARAGWTRLVIDPERKLRAVDGLITGWHEPEASHLQMLEAVAGAELLQASYRAALAGDYLWHEFGDSHLILP